MRTLTAIILIILFGFLVQSFLPWWTITVLCFLVGLAVNRSWWSALLSGLLGVMVLWLGMIFYQTAGNNGILLQRMAGVMDFSEPMLYLITLAIGGVLGGLSSLTGFTLKIEPKKKRKNKYHV